MNGTLGKTLALKSNTFKEECLIKKYIIITTPNCPNCKMAKTITSDKPYTDDIEFLCATTPEGREWAIEYNIQVAGYFIINTETGEVKRVVDFVQEMDKDDN